MQSVKIILFISNLILVIAGAALLFLGMATWFYLAASKDGISVLHALAVLVIVLGSITLLIAFFGCCGVIKENSCMLTTYSIFMLLLTALGLALAILLLCKHGDTTRLLFDELKFEEQYHTAEQNYIFLHTIEKTLKCCGLNGPVFYENRTTIVNETSGTNITWGPKNLPLSCCETTQNETTTVNCTISIAYIGCENQFPFFAKTMGLVLCVVACIELLAALLGLHLKKARDMQPNYW